MTASANGITFPASTLHSFQTAGVSMIAKAATSTGPGLSRTASERRSANANSLSPSSLASTQNTLPLRQGSFRNTGPFQRGHAKMSQMTLRPRTPVGWFARITVWAISLVPTLGVFVALGFAFGPAVAIVGFVLGLLGLAYAYRSGMKLRHAMQEDPAAAFRRMDKSAIREGKLFAGFAFLTMGVGIVAIIAIFATHT